MIKCLVNIINAIREARREDIPADVEPLMDFCTANGIDSEKLDEMIAAPGDMDTGNMFVYFQRKEAVAAAKKTTKKKAKKKAGK